MRQRWRGVQGGTGAAMLLVVLALGAAPARGQQADTAAPPAADTTPLAPVPTISLHARVRARELRVHAAPEARLRLHACPGADTSRVSVRSNLPERLESGAVYHDIEIRVEAHSGFVERLLVPADSAAVAGPAPLRLCVQSLPEPASTAAPP